MPFYQVYFITADELPKVKAENFQEFFEKLKEETAGKYVNDLDRNSIA